MWWLANFKALESSRFFNPFHSGLRPGDGTDTALVALVDDMQQELDRGTVTPLILLTFDTIDIGILLGHFSGLGGIVLWWF